MLTAGAACMFLPGAGRVWAKLGSGLFVPESTIAFISVDGDVLCRRPIEPGEAKVIFNAIKNQHDPITRLLRFRSRH